MPNAFAPLTAIVDLRFTSKYKPHYQDRKGMKRMTNYKEPLVPPSFAIICFTIKLPQQLILSHLTILKTDFEIDI